MLTRATACGPTAWHSRPLCSPNCFSGLEHFSEMPIVGLPDCLANTLTSSILQVSVGKLPVKNFEKHLMLFRVPSGRWRLWVRTVSEAILKAQHAKLASKQTVAHKSYYKTSYRSIKRPDRPVGAHWNWKPWLWRIAPWLLLQHFSGNLSVKYSTTRTSPV